MSLSLVMIVKNEEKFLARALGSVRGYVDEMIVVDTGSTDKTKEIAAGYGATVLDYRWRDDFAAARNFGLEAARSEWIFVLDADEELVSGHHLLPQLTASDQWDLFLLGYEVGGDPALVGTGSYPKYSVPRLFRNRPEIRYFLPIHENPHLPDRTRGCFCHDVTILHFGPSFDTPAELEQRAQRNIRILKSAVEEQPEEGFLWVHLAAEYVTRGEHAEARPIYRRAIELSAGKGDHYIPAALRDLALCCRKLNDLDEAAAVIAEAKDLFPDYTDLVYLEGEIAEIRNQAEAAAELFQRCLVMGDPPQRYDSWGGTGSWRAQHKLAAMGVVSGQTGSVGH